MTPLMPILTDEEERIALAFGEHPGPSIDDVALRFGLSRRQVKRCMDEARAKTGCSSRTALVALVERAQRESVA